MNSSQLVNAGMVVVKSSRRYFKLGLWYISCESLQGRIPATVMPKKLETVTVLKLLHTVAVSRFFAMTVCKLTIITEIQDQFFITWAPVFALHLQVI